MPVRPQDCVERSWFSRTGGGGACLSGAWDLSCQVWVRMNFPVKQEQGARAEVVEHASRFAPAPQTAGEEQPLDIRAMLEPVLRWKWVVGFIVILVTAAALFVVQNLAPTYSATARVIFDPERLQIIDLDNVIARPDISTTGLQNQIEILRSATLLERVVDTLRLDRTQEFNPALRTDPPNMLEQALSRAPLPDKVAGLLKRLNIEPPNARERAAALSPEEVRLSTIETLIDRLMLRQIPNSRVMEIGLTLTNPVLAAQIVNMISEQYIQVQIERKRDDISAATELLGVRVQDLENRLNASEEAVEIARLELVESAGFSSTMIGQQLETLNTQLSDARLAVSDSEARLERAQAALDDPVRFGTIEEFRASPTIQGYRMRELEFLDQLASLRSIVGASNPELTRLEARLDEVRRSIRTEAEIIIAGLEEDVLRARSREDAIDESLKGLQERAIDQSRSEIRVQRLERDAEATRMIYETFLNRMKETSEQANLQTSDAQILTRAVPPEQPDSSSARKILAAGVAGGMMLGLGFVFVVENLNNTFRSPADIERRTGLPVLAAVPDAGRMKRPRDIMAYLLGSPHSSLGESIRNLRTSILYSNIDMPPKVVMFTSSLPAEGKTTTALLAAITSQHMGRSAIILDCDLRRRTLGDTISVGPEHPGLLAVLEGKCSLEDAIITEPDSGLHILTSEAPWSSNVNPADILASERFRNLVEQLRARYDLVILDTPPTLVVSDSRILAQLADVVVYMARWNHTKRNAVLEGLRELASVNANTAGIVFSRVDERRARKYSDTEYYYKQKYKKYIKS